MRVYVLITFLGLELDDSGGSCEGDSGGPLVIFLQNQNNPRYLQVGLVQGGIGKCGNEKAPSVYIKLEDEEIHRFVWDIVGDWALPPTPTNYPCVTNGEQIQGFGDKRILTSLCYFQRSSPMLRCRQFRTVRAVSTLMVSYHLIFSRPFHLQSQHTSWW